MWRITSEADKHIIEDNQRGVNSRYYEPGPLAGMEAVEQRFVSGICARSDRAHPRSPSPLGRRHVVQAVVVPLPDRVLTAIVMPPVVLQLQSALSCGLRDLCAEHRVRNWSNYAD